MAGEREDNRALKRRVAALEAELAALRVREAANRAAAEEAAVRLAFLADASVRLAGSLDYETTMASVARLAIPLLGDSCVLHIIDADGTIRYVAQAHIIPAKEELVRRLRQRHPLTWESDHPLVWVLRSGQPFLNDDAGALIRGQVGDDPAAHAILDALGYRAMLIVPLIVRGEIKGALSLIISEGDRHYQPGDIAFAQELASRAAQAIENARLYQVAQEAIGHKDALLSELQRTQQQLLHAQRLESVGRLAAGVAHDFNNLLTVIGGYAGLSAAGAEADPERQEALGQIIAAVDRAAALTRQLLAFARKQPFSPRPTDLAGLLHGVQRMISRLIGEQIRLSLSVAPDLWPIHADPRQIEQVLLNLAVNARDAMAEGGSLGIAAANQSLDQPYEDAWAQVPAGDYVLLRLSDSGSGIPPEVQDRVFEPFFTTKELGHGTGLGLAMCYGIIQQHGGAITFSSAAGQGTTFSIYLPRLGAEQTQQPSEATAFGSAGYGSETVLVVEDEPAVRELVARVLRERGYTVLTAEHGAAALELLGRPEPPRLDLLISDVRMPQLSGPALVRQLRAAGANPRVLFISGYTDSQLSEGDLRETGDLLIYKPFAAEHLLRQVRRLLDA